MRRLFTIEAGSPDPDARQSKHAPVETYLAWIPESQAYDHERQKEHRQDPPGFAHSLPSGFAAATSRVTIASGP